MRTCRDFIVFLCRTAIGSFMFGAAAQAQTTLNAEPSQRIEIGSGFSIAAPTGDGWRKTGDPASYLKVLGPEHHSLVFMANTGPSGITHQDILGFREPGGVDRMIKLMAQFSLRASKAHASGLQGERFESVELVTEMGDKYKLGDFICTYSRIVVRDREAVVDGSPTRLRYVAYSCLGFPDMRVAVSVSYSERGREQDLSEDAMAEGERFARSLQRSK